MNSINTNVGAMVALQNLNSTATALQTSQSRINTGLKVANAKDDGAAWAMAQNMRSNVSALDSVKDSLSRASSTVDVAVSAGEQVSDLLSQMKAKAVAASDLNVDANGRAAMNEDFKSFRDQITRVVNAADFNGSNMVKSGGTSISAMGSADGTSKVTVAAQSLALGGTNVTLSATASIGTATAASALLTTLDSSISNTTAAVAKLGTGANALQRHSTFIGKLQDSLTAGIGNLVDADLAKESAKLQALQTKQQLGVQALSIANSAPNSLLSLFR